MDHERKKLLVQKKAQLKTKQKRAEIQQYKDRFTKGIEYFIRNVKNLPLPVPYISDINVKNSTKTAVI